MSILTNKNIKSLKLVISFYAFLVTLYNGLIKLRFFNRIKYPRIIKSFELKINNYNFIINLDTIFSKILINKIFIF